MTTTTARNRSGTVQVLAMLVIVAGAVMAVAGVVTWVMVQNTLADEKITVSDDATYFAGEEVDGPLTAASEAQTIEKHALEASGGATYAELPQDDPNRQTVMTASFLRASLFTSVVSFGVAAMAVGLGLVLILIGIALRRLGQALVATGPSVVTAQP
jgi:ABC-type Fe3+-siderophore transport system permease subunit